MEALLFKLLILFLLLFFSAFFSGTETALFSLQQTELLSLAKSKDRKEKKVSSLMNSPQKILITILIGNLLVNIFISSITTKIFLNYFADYGHLLTIAVITPMIILFGEITPKLIAISNSIKFSKRVIDFLYLCHYIFFPIRFIYQLITKALVKIFRINLTGENHITEEEMDLTIAMSESKGVLQEEESEFIRNILRKFSKKTAENVMIPRNKAVSIPYGATIEEAKKVFQESEVVRAVVYKEDMDHIIGQIDSRDLIPFMFKMRTAKNINRIITPITHYPESRELGELLDDFLKDKIQIAVVVDEYGGTSGIVTLSSIVSELLGEKFSLTEKVEKPDVKKVDDLTSIISGDMQINDFNVEMNDNINSTDAETMGGFIIEQLGHFPSKSEFIRSENYRFKVKSIRKNKILSIEAVRNLG